MLLDEESKVVAHLREAVGDVFGQGLVARLEDQADAGAVQRLGVEAATGRGDG